MNDTLYCLFYFLLFAINCCRNQLRLNICLSDNHDEDVDSS